MLKIIFVFSPSPLQRSNALIKLITVVFNLFEITYVVVLSILIKLIQHVHLNSRCVNGAKDIFFIVPNHGLISNHGKK